MLLCQAFKPAIDGNGLVIRHSIENQDYCVSGLDINGGYQGVFGEGLGMFGANR